MKHHGILFKAEMIRALLDERKTQTRRLVKFPVIDRQGTGCEIAGCEINSCLEQGLEIAPYIVKGLLYAKETFAYHICANKDGEQIHFQADGKCCPNDGERLKWKSSLFMPKKLSRIWLEVTAVRCERVQSITESDAIAEGCIMDADGIFPKELPHASGIGKEGWDCAVDWYSDLWNTINTAPGTTWEDSPWVWVYEFKRTDRPQL